MSFRRLKLLSLGLALSLGAGLSGCASSKEWEAERASLEEAVRAERRAREDLESAYTKRIERLEDSVEGGTRELERTRRERVAARRTARELEVALEGALARLKRKEAELAELQAEPAPPSAEGAIALLKAKDEEIRRLRDQLVAIQSGEADEPNPELDGIVTQSGVDLTVPVARIDGRPLSRREFVEFLYRDLGAPHLLELFVNRHLILQEGKARGMTVSDVDVEMWVSKKTLAELERAGSEQKLAQRLAELGFSEAAWKERLRYQARPMILLDRLVSLQRETPEGRRTFEQRVRDAYRELYSERVSARHIFVSLPADAPEAEERAVFAKVDAARKELARGVDFAAVAKRYSEDGNSRELGGQLGTVGREKFANLPRFNAALFSLEAGQLSEPVRSAAGFHLIRVDKRLPPERPFDAEVRRELIARLEQEPPAEGEVKVLLDRLRKRARIQTSLTFE